MMARLDLPAIRQSYPVAAVVGGAGVKLRSIAGELRGCCPFHADRSSSALLLIWSTCAGR